MIQQIKHCVPEDWRLRSAKRQTRATMGGAGVGRPPASSSRCCGRGGSSGTSEGEEGREGSMTRCRQQEVDVEMNARVRV